jgi:glutathione S-transferase
MSGLSIVLGNKKYSSWSLRGWLALKATGEKFDETMIWMYRAETRAEMLKHGPTGLVPILKHGECIVWETIAICEYLAEAFPAAKLWPDDKVAKAHCRSAATEMHGGFAPLRRQLPMDLSRPYGRKEYDAEAAANIERIAVLWREARTRFGAGGPYLYGRFSVADCMYAPVVTRFLTYQVPLDALCAAYCEAIMAHPAMREWKAAGLAETEVGPY